MGLPFNCPMPDAPLSILFLCTGNSARSIMAEAIANQRFGDRLAAVSAGSKPKGAVNPLALTTLESHGLGAEGLRSQSWDEYRGQKFDLVVTLCGSAAEEECPVFPGGFIRVHWGFPDPPAALDPSDMFERVFRGLEEAIGALVANDGVDLDIRAAKVAELVNKRFSGGDSVGLPHER